MEEPSWDFSQLFHYWYLFILGLLILAYLWREIRS